MTVTNDGAPSSMQAEISSTLSQHRPDPPALAHPAVPLAPAGLDAPLSPELGGRLMTMHEVRAWFSS